MAITEVEGRIVPLDDSGALKAALFVPDGFGPHPGVVVLHEAMGLNDDIRRIARRFAEAGYAAIAPDLFSHGNRLLCLTKVLSAGIANGSKDAVLDDIDATRRALGSREEVDGERTAVIGFCMGGGFALAFGVRSDAVQAASVNYGAVPKRQADLRGVCPVIASYGALDKQFAKQGERLDAWLDELGVPHDVKVYDGVGHSFMSYDNAPAWMLRLPTPMQVGYDEPAAEDAWRRILAFFDEHVRGRS